MKDYIDAKCNIFTEYVQVPDELQTELENLCKEMHALGEKCTDYYQFEEQFNATGLSERYNKLMASSKPKAVKMTAEQKMDSINMVKEQISAGEILRDVADTAVTELREEAITKRREQMIEAGVFDEYTRTSNKIDRAARTGKFLFNKFKKK